MLLIAVVLGVLAATGASADTRRTAALPLPPPWPGERAVPTPPAVPRPVPSAPPIVSRGPVTGLPLPRFASLSRSEINLRAGPGTRFPVE
ncbi:MAG: hypothetical protein SNJ73_01810, partial [Acetobacteraceae bacterium]